MAAAQQLVLELRGQQEISGPQQGDDDQRALEAEELRQPDQRLDGQAGQAAAAAAATAIFEIVRLPLAFGVHGGSG
jgi:hypothetical protein